MTLEEKIKILEGVGCRRITPETLNQIKKENEVLYNSLERTLRRRKAKGEEYILIYINNRNFMLYGEEYIKKNDVNSIKKKLELWMRISKA